VFAVTGKAQGLCEDDGDFSQAVAAVTKCAANHDEPPASLTRVDAIAIGQSWCNAKRVVETPASQGAAMSSPTTTPSSQLAPITSSASPSPVSSAATTPATTIPASRTHAAPSPTPQSSAPAVSVSASGTSVASSAPVASSAQPPSQSQAGSSGAASVTSGTPTVSSSVSSTLSVTINTYDPDNIAVGIVPPFTGTFLSFILSVLAFVLRV